MPDVGGYNFGKEAAKIYADELRQKCIEAGLIQAAAAVRVDQKADGYRVWIPNSVVPYAFVWDNALRHPLNYENQVNAKHAKSWMRHMGKTPKKQAGRRNHFSTKTINSTSAAEKALDAGMNKTVQAWDETEFS